MSTVIQYKNNQKISQHALVESKTENPLLTSITAMEIVGLTWIFKKDEELGFNIQN